MTRTPAWADEVLPTIRAAGFKNSILEFQKEKITPNCKRFIRDNYLSKETYNIPAFYRASKALGPLAEWTKSIIEFADIFEKIEPLRNELNALEAEKATMVEEMSALLAEIAELEASKERMTNEY